MISVRSSNTTTTSTRLLTNNKKESSSTEPASISTESTYSSAGNTKKPSSHKLPSNNELKYSKNKSRATIGAGEDMVQRPTILLKASSTPTNKNEQENGPLISSSQNVHSREQNLKPTSLLSEQQLNKSTSANLNKRIVTTGIELKKPSSPASSYNLLQQFNQTPQIITANKPVEYSTPTQMPSVSSQSLSFIESLSSRLTNNLPQMTRSITLLDECLQWSDALQDYLLDQNEFLVVGILGKNGVGKSTIMSHLAGSYLSTYRFCPFKSSTKETFESAHHETNGIQAFITQERTILLDVQPLLSSSVLEKSINYEHSIKKSTNVDFKYFENLVELQSIELACYLLSICNVVLVVEDWFTDPALFRLLQTAEMLMPNVPTAIATNSTLASSSSANQISSAQLGQLQDEFQFESYPHLIYVLNKCGMANKIEINKMKTCVGRIMGDSKLNYKNSINELSNHLNNNVMKKTKSSSIVSTENSSSASTINFVFLPDLKLNENTRNGLPSYKRCIDHLTRQVMAVKRSNNLLIQNTEKKWFAYAQKMWENIRKSQLFNEYNRLMT